MESAPRPLILGAFALAREAVSSARAEALVPLSPGTTATKALGVSPRSRVRSDVVGNKGCPYLIVPGDTFGQVWV